MTLTLDALEVVAARCETWPAGFKRYWQLRAGRLRELQTFTQATWNRDYLYWLDADPKGLAAAIRAYIQEQREGVK